MPLAVICRELGPPEGMRLEERPPLPLGAGQVRVRLRAAGVNFPDILTVAGTYQHKPPLPFVPGLEAAGEVAEVSPGVAGVAAGDRVIVELRHGGYAEEAVVAAEAVSPLPAGYDYAEGAAFRVAYLTAYHALVERAALRAGETLLVHGAGGGVGLAAVEIGSLVGARVIAVASSGEKLAAAAARGAAHGVLSTGGGFREAVRRHAPRGADVIYDPVGGAVLEESLRCMARGCRLLVIGFASGSAGQAATNLLLIKEAALLGVRAGEAGRHDPVLRARTRTALLALAAQGKLRPTVSHRLPLPRWAEAMRLLAGRRAIGRVVLTMEG